MAENQFGTHGLTVSQQPTWGERHCFSSQPFCWGWKGPPLYVSHLKPGCCCYLPGAFFVSCSKQVNVILQDFQPRKHKQRKFSDFSETAEQVIDREEIRIYSEESDFALIRWISNGVREWQEGPLLEAVGEKKHCLLAGAQDGSLKTKNCVTSNTGSKTRMWLPMESHIPSAHSPVSKAASLLPNYTLLL